MARPPPMPMSTVSLLALIAAAFAALSLIALTLHVHRNRRIRRRVAALLVEQSIRARGLSPAELQSGRDRDWVHEARERCARCGTQDACLADPPGREHPPVHCPNRNLLDTLHRWHRPPAMYWLAIARDRPAVEPRSARTVAADRTPTDATTPPTSSPSSDRSTPNVV